jgi:hypothetical protein
MTSMQPGEETRKGAEVEQLAGSELRWITDAYEQAQRVRIQTGTDSRRRAGIRRRAGTIHSSSTPRIQGKCHAVVIVNWVRWPSSRGWTVKGVTAPFSG